MKKSFGGKLFDIFNIILMTLFCLTIVFPFIQQIVISFSPAGEANVAGLHLYTKHPVLDAYKQILSSGTIVKAYFWTILRTVLGTFLTVTISVMLAYPLTKKYLVGRKIFIAMIVFTMFFNGSMIPSGGNLIPTFLLVKNLNLTNTIWSLILPGLCTPYTIIIIRNFLNSIPAEMEESVYVDGANEIQAFFKIIVPLSMPIIATVSLWTMVAHWNAWFDAMIYITSNKIKILQILLRDVLNSAEDSGAVTSLINDADGQKFTKESSKAAILMVTTAPILMVYPFLQKYFVKGIMIGAVKG